MPWKTTSRRHVGPKVKLPRGHPLPEPAEDMAIKVEEHAPDEGGDVAKERSSFEISDIAASLPDISGGLESKEFCFDRYISDLEVDQDSDDYHSLFNDSGTSTLGQSASSFMSWMDEAELEKSKEVQRLVDEIDNAIYDGMPFPVTDQKALEVLHQIKDSQLHLRVIGEQLQNIPEGILAFDEDLAPEQDVIHVLASHGVYEENNKVIPNQPVVLPKEDDTDILEMKHGSQVKYIEEVLLHHENEGLHDDMKCNVEKTNAGAVSWSAKESRDRFIEKVKSFVMDQLVHYVLSEAVQPCELVRDKNIPSLSEDDEQVNQHSSSLRPNTREDDDFEDDVEDDNADIFQRPNCVQQPAFLVEESSITSTKHAFASFLHVSPMTIHPLPRKFVSNLKYSNTNSNFEVPFFLNQPPTNRNAMKEVLSKPDFCGPSQISMKEVLNKPNFCGPSEISVVSLSKPSNVLPRCIEAEKGVKVRGYHSAAVVKKPGLLERRFSITASHERFLEPLAENHSVNKNHQQTSAPSSPAKWLRRHTLPPINRNGLTPLSKSPEAIRSNASLLATKLIDSSKHKVALLPLKVPVLGTGLTRLQLAKQLLEQADCKMVWNTTGALDGRVENIKDFGKTKEEKKPRGGNRH
ncbi:uncharacterized protein [Anabrus simplex]|uniref:uncharacterized protein isoform X2 n=1 Tax=Anabrus simplex TaxID=316456 RepID=UPI0035A2CFB0